MTRKDVCFLGFLALACLYLDQRTSPQTAPRRVGIGDRSGSAPTAGRGRAPEIRVVRRDACPRDPDHAVSLRHDGAMWCRQCDKAYYPRVAEWEAGLAGVAA